MTKITCTADALSRGASAALARGTSPSKNVLLNALAAAIAGPGHDWGYLKNHPTDFVQNGIQPSTPASIWLVLYDEQEDWARDPQAFASKEDALDYVKNDSWWAHKDHPADVVLDALEDGGTYVFRDDNDDDFEEAAYSISIMELPIQGRTAPAPKPQRPTAPQNAPEASMHFPRYIVKDGAGLKGSNLDIGDDALYERREDIPQTVDQNDIFDVFKITIKAQFVPQAWVRDYAVEVDCEGEDTWTLSPQEIDLMAMDNDYLKDSHSAPQWVKDWTGPFEIYIEADL